jgi:hypothetical protein
VARLSRRLIPVSLCITGLVHLLPVAGVLGGEWLGELYGVTAGDANLELLLRHRAMLFGIVGGLLMVAAFRPALRMSAFVAGFVSMMSFIGLSWLEMPLNAALSRVVIVDLIATVVLLAGLVAWRQQTGEYSRRHIRGHDGPSH